MRRSFDSLASIYLPLERLSFGCSLEAARNRGLEAIDPNAPQTLLLLGDGDGRFAFRALEKNPNAIVYSIDRSPKMLRRAQSRIEKLGPSALRRFNPIQSNVFDYEFPEKGYDVIAAQFFLDCFQTIEANQLLSRIAQSLKPKGRFIYADFSIPEKPPWSWLGLWIVKSLYCFFGLATDIEARELPELVWPETLIQLSRRTARKGLLVSEIRMNRAR